MSQADPATYRHSPRTRRVLLGLMRVLCPPEAEALADGILDRVAMTLSATPAPVRLSLLAGLHAYDAAAIPLHGRRACNLDTARAQSYLAAWRRRSAITREVVQAAKSLLCIAYYEMPEVKEAMGYRPQQWIDSVRRRRLTLHQAAIRRHALDILEPDPLPAPSGAAAPGGSHGRIPGHGEDHA